MTFDKIVLESNLVRLEPLTREHKQGLCEAISDGELWKLQVTLVPHPDNIDAFIDKALDLYATGDGITFVTVDNHSNKIVGSSRFMKADFSHKKVEIGYTFLAKSAQRTRINTQAKLLMLSYAFDELHFNRVEFLTDYLNKKSRDAILNLGAKQEGILCNHMVMPDGRVRDSVLFSIING
ncbi:MAG: GNAT family N-acetyltransferase, partial [Pseudomonadales bacterium]|nr:GNAT family N-acetyltransferase [Pseudomonadales bacterium]